MSLFALLLTQGPDARLAARATLERPYATLAEIGAWVQERSGVPVYVAPAIRGRKATVLVADRPLHETMDRIAEALFLQWERTKDGYTLRLAEGVGQEEARIADAEARATRQAAVDALDRLAGYARYSTPEAIQSALDAAKTEVEVAKRDPSEAGKAALAAAQRRSSELSTYSYAKHYQAGAALVAGLSPARRAAIVDGQTVYGSTRPIRGFVTVPSTVSDLVAAMHGNAQPGDRTLLSVNYDPTEGALTFAESRWSGGSGGGSSMQLKSADETSYKAALRDQPLQRRLREWAKTDLETLATKLAPARPESSEAVRPTPYRTLAEILTDLHARTGLPIVADGFRIAVVAKKPPDGATLDLWNRALNPWSDGRFRGYRPVFRAVGGWAMFRHPQYWKMIPREAPESAVAALEAAWRRPQRATLDDYAAFAGRLTPVQALYAGKTSPVMALPGDPLDGSIPFLRLWSALAGGQRRVAATEAGLSVGDMSRDQRTLVDACFVGKRGTIFEDDATLAFWMPGGPPLPDTMRLFVNLSAKAMPQDWVDPDFSKGGRTYMQDRDSVPAVTGGLGTLEKRSMAFFSVPLAGPKVRE